MKLSSIPFWQLSPISFVFKRIIITLFTLYGMMMIDLVQCSRCFAPKKADLFQTAKWTVRGFYWTRWMMMVIYPWWWSWWSGFVSARHSKKPQLAVKWANGGHPTSELQLFVSIQITEKNYIENFIVLSHRSILLTYSLLYLHSVLSQLFTHAGTLHII